jgi:competence protein ComEC
MTRQQFFPLVFLSLALGMGAYFSWPREPNIYVLGSAVMICLVFQTAIWRRTGLAVSILWLVLSALLGALWAQSTTLRQAARLAKVSFAAHGETVMLDGQVVWSEPRSRGSVVDVAMVSAAGKGYQVRVFGAKSIAAQALPGCQIRAQAFVKPIGTPIAKGAYDPRLTQFFNGRKGQGFLRHVEHLDCQGPISWRLHLARLRLHIAARFRNQMEAPQGALAASLITGIRGAIPPPTRQLFRDAGLAHVLAISGLHMALFAGTFFAALRLFAASWPRLAQSYDMRRVSAGLAIVAATAYLAVSGASYATQRAFIMISIFFLAVVLGRAGLTLRNLSWAGIVILALRPSAVMQAGFQMSFAAVMALIVYYEYWQSRASGFRRMDGFTPSGRFWHYLRVTAWGLVSTSAIAGSVTGYIAAYHFGQIASFGLLANVLAMPVFSLLVMPMAAASLVLMPLGFEAVPLAVMAWGLSLIINISQWVTSFSGSVWYLAPTPYWALLSAVLGLVMVSLLRGRARWASLVPLVFALAMLQQAPRPLVAWLEAGNTIAVQMTPQNMTLIRQRGNRYLSELLGDYWRMSDLSSPACGEALCAYELVQSQRLALVNYRHALTRACAEFDIVLAPRLTALYPCQADLWDKPRLQDNPSVEIYDRQKPSVTRPKMNRLWQVRVD